MTRRGGFRIAWVENVRFALSAMRAQKLRSFLTLLGVMAGVATVIMMVSFVTGFNNQVTAAFTSFGTHLVQIQKYNGSPIGLQFPPHVELAVTYTEPGVRGDTASGGVTKLATLETGLQIRVPLFIKEGEKVKVHTETREFAGRA